MDSEFANPKVYRIKPVRKLKKLFRKLRVCQRKIRKKNDFLNERSEGSLAWALQQHN